MSDDTKTYLTSNGLLKKYAGSFTATELTNPNSETLRKVALMDLGENNTSLYDPENKFKYSEGADEQVLPEGGGKHNTWIVFGRDRYGELDDRGYGARGSSKAGAIDIVVGRMSKFSANSPEFIDKKVSPNIAFDGARIYLSQKADIDSYYGIKPAITGMAEGNSAIAIKADDVRIVARNSIKIVTKTEQKTSFDKTPVDKSGVQLIANNDDSDMQPIPKGSNLEEALLAIVENIRSLNGILAEFVKIQTAYNNELATHVHYSPFFAEQSSPSPEALPQGISTSMQVFTKTTSDCLKLITNLKSTKYKYLMPSGKKYINSSYNFVN